MKIYGKGFCDEKEILLKAFKIMLENYDEEKDMCEDIGKCSECPFESWEVCPNCCKEDEE